MRAQVWVMAGLSWLALSGGRERAGLVGESSAYAQPKGADKPEARPAAAPGERASERPGEPPRRPASAPPAASPGARPPQVRTYSSVTVVDDPKQAPPLPTGRKEAPPAALPKPLTEPRRDEPAAKDERPAAESRRSEEIKELRRDLRELRQELREQRGGRDGEGPAACGRPTPAESESRKHPERAPVRERLHSGRE